MEERLETIKKLIQEIVFQIEQKEMNTLFKAESREVKVRSYELLEIVKKTLHDKKSGII